MKKTYTSEDLKAIENLRKLYKDANGKDISFERAAELMRFSRMLIKIATGKFRCENCGGEQQIYVFKR